MANIEDVNQLATSTPEEAAVHIDNSSIFGIEPSAYKQFKDELNPKVEMLKKPTDVTPVVEEHMRKSTEHASLMTPDVESLSWLEKQAMMIGDYVNDRPTISKKIVDLNKKRMNDPDSFTEEDDLSLFMLGEESKLLAAKNYGLDGPLEQLPAKAAGFVSDMVRPIVEGAVEGVGLPGKVPGPGGLGVKAGFGVLKHAYDTLAGGTFHEASNLTDENGQPLNLSHDTKKHIAQGVGVVGAAIYQFMPAQLGKMTPWLAKFVTPSMAKILVMNPTHAAAKAAAIKIGQSALVLGGASGATRATQIVGIEMAKISDDSEASFVNALVNAATNIENWKQVGDATAAGAAAGVALSFPLQVAGFPSTRRQFTKAQGIAQQMENARPMNAKDVTPGAPAQVTGGSPPTPAPIDVVWPSGPPEIQAQKIILLGEAVTNIAKVAKSTGMAKLAPNQLTNFKKSMWERAGVGHVWVAKEAALKWVMKGDLEKRRDVFRSRVDPSGSLSAGINSPIKIPMHQFAEIVREFPDAVDLMQSHPNGPNRIQAEQWLKDHQEKEDQRQEILQNLGVQPKAEITDDAAKVLSTVFPKPGGLKNDLVDFSAKELRKSRLLQKTYLDALVGSPLDKEMRTQVEADLKILDEHIGPHPSLFPDHTQFDWTAETTETAAQAEEKYLYAPTFTEAIRKILPESTVTKLDDAQLAARTNNADDIEEAARFEMDQVRDVEIEAGLEIQKEIEEERLANSPNVALVEKFLHHTVPNGKKYVSFYAMDPLLLDDSLLHFVDHPQIKEHGVFVKGRMHPEEAVKLIGGVQENSVELFLAIMANTPSRAKLNEARTLAHLKEVEARVDENLKFDETNVVKALNDRTSLVLGEMKFMRVQKWPALKAGIKIIALPLPTMPELAAKSRAVILQTKVGDLNARQFEVGERTSKRIAVNAVLKNEIEKAFQAKEAEAMNIQMQKETLIGTGLANRVIRFGRRIDMEAIKEAGPAFEKPAIALLDLFNLDPSKRGLAEKEAYLKFVKQQEQAGNGDFSIPDRLSDLRQSVNDMTLEALLVVGDKLKAIQHLAKMKNRLLAKHTAIKEAQTVEALEEKFHKLALEHPDYSETRYPSVQEAEGMERVHAAFDVALSLLDNMKYEVTTLDKEIINGPWYELLVHKLSGSGEFQNKMGTTGEIHETVAFSAFLKKNIEYLGTKEYRDLRNTRVFIPEFKGLPKITNHKNGRITKDKLLVLAANMGDPLGRENIEKLGIDLPTMEKILSRELTNAHVDFVQNFMVGGLASYAERSINLHKETTGLDVEMIKGVSWTHNGRAMPGGYYRQRYRVDFTGKIIDKTLQEFKDGAAVILGEKNSEIYARQYAAEMTDQSRFEQRKGSNQALDLSFNGSFQNFTEVMHDLNWRVPVIDTLKILRSESIKSDIIRIRGVEKYRMMVNSVVEQANKVEAQNTTFFSDQGNFLDAMSGAGRGTFAISVLAANITSAMIQPVSLVTALQRMGFASGAKHMTVLLAKVIRNPILLGHMYELATEINPKLKNGQDGVAEVLTSSMADLMPRKNLVPGMAPLDRGRRWLGNTGMAPLKIVDDIVKTFVYLTAYRQFTAGDSIDYPRSRLDKMTKAEIDTAAKAYVEQLSDISLTHSTNLDRAPIQKFPLTKPLTMFWNDPRNVWNNQLALTRKMKWDLIESYEKFKDKEYKDSAKSARGVFAGGISMFIGAAIARVYMDTIYGRDNPSDQKYDWSTEKGWKSAAENWGAWFATGPYDITLDMVPVVRDVKFAADRLDQRRDTRNVQIPFTKALSDVATAYRATAEMLFMDRKEFSPQQIKAFLFVASYATGGVPINAAYKLHRYIDEKKSSGAAKEYIANAQSDADTLHHEIKEYLADPPPTVPPEFLKQLEELDRQLTPPESASVPHGTIEAIRHASTQGEWTTPVMSEAKWNDIKARAPNLGLTENGRVSKDPSQQDKALAWVAEQDAKALDAKGLPVTKDSLYASHLFTSAKAAELYTLPADTKANKVLSPEDLAALPKLKTIGQVRKFLKSKTTDKALTSHTANTED